MLDWLAREGWIVLSWWALVTLAGAAIFPALVRLLGGLPDKGYLLARAAGLLVVGFVFWLLVSLGFLRNTTGSMLLAWIIVLVGSLVIYLRGGLAFDWRAWWRENRSVVIVGEVLFIVLLVGWALLRSQQNNLTGTEKTMELMMMSSVMRSETFPPNDAWLSGYAISYYYFGYVLSAMLSMLSGIASTAGFNMTISLLFALTGLTTFGVVSNLVRSRASQGITLIRPAILTGLLGAFFVIFFSNLQPIVVEVPYQAQVASEDYLRFWDTKNRDVYQEGTPALNLLNPVDAQRAFYWWFNASRTLTERDLTGQRVNEVIDEFPQFSFLLADVHPHVLALPFAVLALGLALNVVLTMRDPNRLEIVFYGVCLGGLVFLNTWDGPIYMAVLVGADALRRLHRNGTGGLTLFDWLRLAGLGLALLVLTGVLYYPFLLGFRSQAGGILPNLLYPTRFQQYFLMFGGFMLLLIPYLLLEAWRARERMNWRLGLVVAVSLWGGLLLLMLMLVLAGSLVEELRNTVVGFVDLNGGWATVLPQLLSRRLITLPTTLLLVGAVLLIVGRMFARPPEVRDLPEDAPIEQRQVIAYPRATGFALLLIGGGVVLTLIPEFVYLRDNFGTRMNTIFKFYYQAWVMFSVAGAYSVYSMLADVRLPLPAPALRAVLTAVVVTVLLTGSVYGLIGYSQWVLVGGNAAVQYTLDGAASTVSAGDLEAITCLKALVGDEQLVVAEAVGNSYGWGYGRVANLTGIPIVVNWPGHQSQWRGPTYGESVGSRVQDVERLYSDLRWDIARDIIDQYDIDYIFYGLNERNDYGGGGEDKFAENLQVVCDRGGSRFYQVTPAVATAVNG